MFELYEKIPKRIQKKKKDTKQSQKQNIFQRRSIRKENALARVLDKGSNKQNDVHCDGENWNRAMFSKVHGQREKRVEGVEPMKGEYPGVSVTGRSESRKFRGWKPLSSFPRGIRVGPWASQVRSFVEAGGGAPFIQCRGCRGRDCEAKAIIVAKLERCRLRGWPTTRPNSGTGSGVFGVWYDGSGPGGFSATQTGLSRRSLIAVNYGVLLGLLLLHFP